MSAKHLTDVDVENIIDWLLDRVSYLNDQDEYELADDVQAVVDRLQK